MKNSPQFNEIPNDLITLVFSFLSPAQLMNVSETCKKFLEIHSDNTIWLKKLNEENFDPPPGTHKIKFKETYKENVYSLKSFYQTLTMYFKKNPNGSDTDIQYFKEFKDLFPTFDNFLKKVRILDIEATKKKWGDQIQLGALSLNKLPLAAVSGKFLKCGVYQKALPSLNPRDHVFIAFLAMPIKVKNNQQNSTDVLIFSQSLTGPKYQPYTYLHHFKGPVDLSLYEYEVKNQSYQTIQDLLAGKEVFFPLYKNNKSQGQYLSLNNINSEPQDIPCASSNMLQKCIDNLPSKATNRTPFSKHQ